MDFVINGVCLSPTSFSVSSNRVAMSTIFMFVMSVVKISKFKMLFLSLHANVVCVPVSDFSSFVSMFLQVNKKLMSSGYKMDEIIVTINTLMKFRISS